MKNTNRQICFAALLTSAFLTMFQTYRSREPEEPSTVGSDLFPVLIPSTNEAAAIEANNHASKPPERAPEVGDTEFVVDSDSPRTKPLPDKESTETLTRLEQPFSDQDRFSPSDYFAISGVALIDAYKRTPHGWPDGRVVSEDEHDAILNRAAERGATIVPLQTIIARRPHDEIVMEVSQAERPESPWMSHSLHVDRARGRGDVLWSEGRLYDLENGQFVDEYGNIFERKVTRPENCLLSHPESWRLNTGNHLIFRDPDYRGFRFSFYVKEVGTEGLIEIWPGHNLSSWMRGEPTSTGTFGLLPSRAGLGQRLYFEHHPPGPSMQLLFNFQALNPTEWSELLEGAASQHAPHAQGF